MAERYRVLACLKTGASGLYGWKDRVTSFSSKEEALSEIQKPMLAGCYKLMAQELVNNSWVTIGSRKRKTRRN